METYVEFYYKNVIMLGVGVLMDLPPRNKVLMLNDAIAFLDKIVVDDKFLYINNIMVRVTVNDKKFMVKADLFDGFQLYSKQDYVGATYDGPLKDCSLFNAETIKIISDHHDRTIANDSIKKLMTELNTFLKKQTSYDTVVQYEKLLDTLECLV